MEEIKSESSNDKVCCEVLLKLTLGWFKLEDGSKVMPYIYDNSNTTMLRVNHCPSCGKYIRDIELRM